jgi:hypothetical protein
MGKGCNIPVGGGLLNGSAEDADAFSMASATTAAMFAFNIPVRLSIRASQTEGGIR